MKEKEKVFSDLVKRHKNTIFTVCYLFSKDQEEANDLFQETLINLWRGFDSFQGKCDVKTWIWRVSFNTCLTFERKKKRHVETVPFNMDINLFTDTDDDTKQIQNPVHLFLGILFGFRNLSSSCDWFFSSSLQQILFNLDFCHLQFGDLFRRRRSLC